MMYCFFSFVEWLTFCNKILMMKILVIGGVILVDFVEPFLYDVIRWALWRHLSLRAAVSSFLYCSTWDMPQPFSFIGEKNLGKNSETQIWLMISLLSLNITFSLSYFDIVRKPVYSSINVTFVMVIIMKSFIAKRVKRHFFLLFFN